MLDGDTIVAIATAPGRGGIGVVRLSGPRARAVAEPLVRLRHPLTAGAARFGHLVDEAGATLDEVVVTWFSAPRSYTAEDVVEIAAHGAPVLLQAVLRACLQGGARLAGPGEFTQRAFLNGRLDLTQAEAVNDLIGAQTLHQARVAAAQLGGSVARAVGPAKARLVELIAELEAGIDFAEDDLELMPAKAISAAIAGIRAEVEALAATYGYGRMLREGLTLAIVGLPNAGKSSLFNRLLKRERSIVTAEPGTTRDTVAERVSLGGIPVELVDTAGLRAPAGLAEAEGVARTRQALAEADFVVQVIDATGLGKAVIPAMLDTEDRATLAGMAGRPHQVVFNKADLLGEGLACEGFDPPALVVSAKTGAGVGELEAAILAQVAGEPDGAMVTNLRQHEALREAAAGLERAADAARDRVPQEMVLLDLHAGLEGLDRLTGATTTEEILGMIFGRFCIGK